MMGFKLFTDIIVVNNSDMITLELNQKHKKWINQMVFTCEQLAMILLGRPILGAQATSLTQSL